MTEDAERTMATHLGVASDFSSVDLHDAQLTAAQVVYLEGYLWEQPSAKAAMRQAIEVAHANNAAVALSLSDPFCVEHHRREFLDLLTGDLDLLFANEEELTKLFGLGDTEAALRAVEETGVLAAVTRGAAGCVVVTAQGPMTVPAAPVDRVVDTTGAGDLFAAGFLYGITSGIGPVEAARLGGLCAAEVISHVGARPLADFARAGCRRRIGRLLRPLARWRRWRRRVTRPSRGHTTWPRPRRWSLERARRRCIERTEQSTDVARVARGRHRPTPRHPTDGRASFLSPP